MQVRRVILEVLQQVHHREHHNNALESSYKKIKFKNDLDVVKMIVVYYTVLAVMGKEKTRAYVDMKLFGHGEYGQLQ